MPQFLPLRANLEWLRKSAKERLRALRADDPAAKLADAQLAVARHYGFTSWRKLVAHVEEVRDKLRALVPATEPAAAETVAPDDADLAQLFAAIRAGDVSTGTALLRRRSALANAQGPDGQTPLHAAAQCNDPQFGVVLLAFGADPDARYGSSGHTALSWAATCNAPEFANMLVRLAVQPDLFSAAGIGSLDGVRSCFDDDGTLRPDTVRTGSSRFAADGSRLPCPPPTAVEQISDALGFACRNGYAEVVRYLLTKSTDLTFRGYMGATPLHWAYFGGSRTAIDLLVDAGADSTTRDTALGCTPRAFGICAPANWGFLFLVERRLSADPALLNFMDGRTSALHEAARGGHVEVIRFLLDRGADASLRDGDGKTALDVATANNRDVVAAILRAV
ncbi:MAG: ankyrin repeat domain-containing protein [Gemmataceae bacterium]